VQDCVAFLEKAPDSSMVCVDHCHFVVLGDDFEKRGLVTIWRIGDENLRGDKLESMTCSVKDASVFLYAMEPDYWEENMAEQEGDEPVG
jgi:hypothetical protein